MTGGRSKKKTDLSKMNSDTPPRSMQSNSNTSLPDPQEPGCPNVSFSKQVEKMTDKEVVEHLTNNFPELKDEVRFLLNCPEKIGMEPLRDILINQTKSVRQALQVIKALVTGLKAGLSYSLREQHKTYVQIFNDMRNVMTECHGKLMTEVSKSLSDNLKNENKESGKTLSALKVVLGNAHELTKVLVEGKTHGHLQVPSKPKRSKSTETKAPPSETSPSPDLSEEMTIPAWIKDEFMSMDRQNFEAYTECKGEHITIKTRVCGIYYNITMKI